MVTIEKTNSIKTFNIYCSNGKIKEGLKRSFLVVQNISAQSLASGRILLESDNTIWPLYAEQQVINAFKEKETVKCIISFQTFYNGEYFAVARLYRSRQKPNKE